MHVPKKFFDFIESKYRKYFYGKALQNVIKIYSILYLHVSYFIFLQKCSFHVSENKRKLDLHLNNGITKDDV